MAYRSRWWIQTRVVLENETHALENFSDEGVIGDLRGFKHFLDRLM